MNLYIRIKDGVPFEHPMLESNLLLVYPDINLNNLPTDIATFTRVARPKLGIYQVYSGSTYECIDNIWQDVHHAREMTEEEKIIKNDEIAEAEIKFQQFIQWHKDNPRPQPFPSWIFNENTGMWYAPVKPPLIGTYPDTEYYTWEESTLSWVRNIINI